MARRNSEIQLENEGKKSKTAKSINQVQSVDKLVSAALKDKRLGATLVRTPHYEVLKSDFESSLVRDAKIISSGKKPEEVSKILVDVNEKIYDNCAGAGKTDSTTCTVKIVKRLETGEAFSYEQETTTGLEWGAGTNIGSQFGLPSVNLSGGLNPGFNKTQSTTTTESTTKTSTVGQESHHEETVEIPPGCKVRVTMTSYRIKYRLEYTMEYKVPKSRQLQVRYDIACCLGLCYPSTTLTAVDIFQYMPGFKIEDQHVSFRQKGWLKWVADRMEVDKQCEVQQETQ